MEKSYTILYIDDNEDNRILLGRFLELEGFEVHSFGTGQEGLNRAAESIPDVFLIDINLPDISGYEVIETLNKRAETAHLPKIAFSANTDKQVRSRFPTGPIFFLPKPVDIDTLGDKIRDVIKNPDSSGKRFRL